MFTLDTAAYLHEAVTVTDIVKNWHDDVHPGSFDTCFEQPCKSITTHAAAKAMSQGYR